MRNIFDNPNNLWYHKCVATNIANDINRPYNPILSNGLEFTFAFVHLLKTSDSIIKKPKDFFKLFVKYVPQWHGNTVETQCDAEEFLNHLLNHLIAETNESLVPTKAIDKIIRNKRQSDQVYTQYHAKNKSLL